MTFYWRRFIPCLVTLFLGMGCQSSSESHSAMASSWGGNITRAIAVVHPTAGNQVNGTVTFAKVAEGVRIVAILQGLPPDSVHGFHIHEYGDCSATDASSAGAHYNPEHHLHGGPEERMRHAGDLGNIRADAAGVAKLELIVSDISIAGEKNPVLGRSVVVHAKADDLKSQPTGESGGRIGCGVIGIAKEE